VVTASRSIRMGVIMLLAGWLAACGEPPAPPEEALRAWLSAAELEAEAKDRGALVERISEAYTDTRGNSRADLDRLFRLLFLRQNSVSLLVDIETINVLGDSAAEIELKVGMAGANSSILGFSADAYRFELDLHLEDEQWKLIGARWGELGGQLR
jgi:hypothetical protein